MGMDIFEPELKFKTKINFKKILTAAKDKLRSLFWHFCNDSRMMIINTNILHSFTAFGRQVCKIAIFCNRCVSLQKTGRLFQLCTLLSCFKLQKGV